MPLTHWPLSHSPVVVLPEYIAGAGWLKLATLESWQLDLKQLEELRRVPVRQGEAYLGWLLTNPTFRSELQELNARWPGAGDGLGKLPEPPFEAAPFVQKHSGPKGSRDVTREYFLDFKMFCQRWCLRRLVTWELPEPLGVNVGGPAFTGRLSGLDDAPASQIPIVFKIPARMPIRESLHAARRSSIPEHLRGWVNVAEDRDWRGLGCTRFRSMFHLEFFRETVLRGRYGNRFEGVTEQLDEAFGGYLGTSADTIKKLRLRMGRRRHGTLADGNPE